MLSSNPRKMNEIISNFFFFYFLVLRKVLSIPSIPIQIQAQGPVRQEIFGYLFNTINSSLDTSPTVNFELPTGMTTITLTGPLSALTATATATLNILTGQNSVTIDGSNTWPDELFMQGNRLPILELQLPSMWQILTVITPLIIVQTIVATPGLITPTSLPVFSQNWDPGHLSYKQTLTH